MRILRIIFLLALGLASADAGLARAPGRADGSGPVLPPENFRHYIETFNRNDAELYPQTIPNSAAWDYLSANMPLFECPDPDIERTYYFRWWTFRKHIRQTPDGFVVTEFLPPVPWSGKHNGISCPAGHHFYEAAGCATRASWTTTGATGSAKEAVRASTASGRRMPSTRSFW